MINKIDLRKVFVQLLFSLVIGQAALRYGDLIVTGASFSDYHYAYMHLILSVIIITTSWVGWHNSQSPINSDYIKNVFSLQFLILFIDLCLVVTYFVIVRGSETPLNQCANSIPPASSHIEVKWTMIIFIIYLIWDIFTKAIKFKYEYTNVTFKKIRIFDHKLLFKRMWKTFFCLCVSVFIYVVMQDETDKIRVSLIDLTLIFLFFTFRGIKQDVKKNYDLQENELSEKHKKDIREQNIYVKFPIIINETRKFHYFKIFGVRILPVLLLLFCILYYLFTKYY